MAKDETQQDHLIQSNEYSPHGRSLNYTAPCGMKGTVGVWRRGETIEVQTDLPEIVQIIRGRAAVTVPGLLDRTVYVKRDKFYLPPKQPSVLFEALDGNDVAYECIFYQEELDSERDKTLALIEETMARKH